MYGFTLIELLFCLSLFTLFFVLSHQGWQHLSARQQNESSVFTLFHALHYARQAAVTQQQMVGLGPIAGGFGVFIYSPHAAEKKWLRRYPLLPDISMTSNQPRGFLFTPQGNCITPGTITVQSSPTFKQKIIVNDSGRPRIALAETKTLDY